MTSLSGRPAVIGPPDPAPESGVARHAARTRGVVTAAVLVGYLLAAVLLTWRLWADPASRMVAGNPHDTDQFAWFMRYAATAVRHGRLPALVTTGLNAPTGINLMWNTSFLLPGVVLAPVTWLAGPQASLTILTTVSFAGSAAALFWVLRRWGVSISAAALAGAVYGFSPALVQSALGHYNLDLVILPPLIIHAGLRLAVGPPLSARSAGRPARGPARWLARVPPSARTGAWLGLLVAGQLFISSELALTTALAGVLIVLVLAVSRPRAVRERVLPAAGGLAIAVVVALVLTGSALWTQFHGPLAEHGSQYGPNRFANDLMTFVTPQGALFFHTAASAAAAARYKGGPAEYLAYLGWPLIAALTVAAVICWRRLAGRTVAVTFIVLCVFSLGGLLIIAPRSHAVIGLPWRLLEAIPILDAVLPARLSILADGFAAALLAIGIDEARARLAARTSGRTRLAPIAVLAVAVLCCLPLLPRPFPASGTAPVPAGWSAVFTRLHLGPGSRVLVVPIPRADITLAMRWSAASGEPAMMIGGYFLGPGPGGKVHLDGTMSNRKVAYLDLLWGQGVPAGSPYESTAGFAVGEWFVTKRQEGPPTPNHWPAMQPGTAVAQLANWRAQAVVADATASSPLGRYLAKILGPPQVSVDDLIGWRVTPASLAAARASLGPGT